MDSFNIVMFGKDDCDKQSSKLGFTKLISFDKVKGKIKEVRSSNEVLSNINFRGLFLIKDYRISSEMIKVIGGKNKSLFLLDLSKIYNSYGIKRAIILSQMRRFLKSCIKYGASYSFVDLSINTPIEHIRNTKEIIAIGSLLGINEGQSKFGMVELGKFI